MNKTKLVLIITSLLIVLAYGLRSSLYKAATKNIASLQTVRGIYKDPSSLSLAKSRLEEIAEEDCRTTWLLSVVAGRMGDKAEQRKLWSSFITCSSSSVNLLRAVGPQDQDLAKQAVQQYPEIAEGRFWLADLIRQSNSEEAIRLYTQGLELRPSNGLAWCDLGRLYEAAQEIESAEKAFLGCCFNGDIGSHGCFGAGRMAEAQGNLSAAIQYYRFSKFQDALDRATSLEKKVQPKP